MIVALASHGASLLAFGGFAVVLLLGGNRRGAALFLVIACGATAAWSGSVALSALGGNVRTVPDLVLETLRSGCWIAFLYRLLGATGKPDAVILSRWSCALVMVVLAILAAADIVNGTFDSPAIATYTVIVRLMIAVVALSLIENLARNHQPAAYWWARFLFIGIGGIFVFDLILYSEALLFRRVNPELYDVRGAVDLIAVPLMAISFARNPTFEVTVHVSRRFVFHTMTLAGAGVYLLIMAVAGYYLREFGGNWGTFLAVTFVSAAIVLVLLTISSGRFRSSVRNFVSANFFSYKFDYRHEWLQFIGLVSAQESLLPLHDRVIHALANIADSPAGTLWIERDGAFVNTASWNAPLSHEVRARDDRLVEWFEAEGAIVELAAESLAGARPPIPGWLSAVPRAWIVVPLIHRHRLLGLLVLARPRAPRRLDDEDRGLLSTAGRQAASYIAEEETSHALLDARQLEVFNQRFAFLVHDIKNLVSQLSLILSNAETHGDNPEFQRDMIATVRHSVGRMKNLLEQLSVARRSAPKDSVFDLAEMLRRDWAAGTPLDRRLHLALPSRPCRVSGEPEAVSQVVRHIVQNALEAVDAAGRVELLLITEPDGAILKVVDDGPGMTAEFIRDKLFRPFSTTKASGYGIGAYQARELIRGMGGRLDVASVPGEGTQVIVRLPAAPAETAISRQVQEA